MEHFISRSIKIINGRNGQPTAIAVEPIQAQSIVEICPVMSITGRFAILLAKSNPSIEKKIIADAAAIQKEYQVFRELSEMELTRRLDAGQISQREYAEILSSKVNLDALLDARTHALPLGYGLAYDISEFPNMVREFNSSSKLCTFRTVQYVQEGAELSYFS
jgi:hypothetical protein